jgi:hypothetical protein
MLQLSAVGLSNCTDDLRELSPSRHTRHSHPMPSLLAALGDVLPLDVTGRAVKEIAA